MFKKQKLTLIIQSIALGAGLLTLSSCETNEQLGRSQLILVDDGALQQASLASWSQLLKKEKISKDAAMNARLQTVSKRIVAAAGMGDKPWEFVLFDNPQPNAFVLPAHKVGVNTGLFKIVKNDDQLAAVIGHETAHVIGRHAAERYSQTVAAQVGLQVATQSTSGNTQKAIANYGGLGAQLGLLLPYSRKHETEADLLGVDIMVKAGYRASESVALWKNMAAMGKNAPPEFMSTHPSDKTRIDTLSAYIAQKGYK